MTVNLRDILSGICLWSLHQDDQNFINKLTCVRVDDLAVMEMMRDKAGLVFFGFK